jgi:diguanylate cyclase (GGDEF)-like protein
MSPQQLVFPSDWAKGICDRVDGASTTASAVDRLGLYAQALDKIRQGLCVFDRHQCLLLFNRRYAEMYSLRPEMLRLGMTLRDVIDLRYAAGTGPDMTRDAYASWRDQIAVANQVVETVVTLRNGTTHEIHHEPTPDGGWVATFDDITERLRIEACIKHMAHHDALTGLPNRILFAERLQDTASGTREAGALAALLCFDLDRFKEVNDALGHSAGDDLLRQVAARVARQLRPGDTLARLGGDEFAVILDGIDSETDATSLAARIIDELTVPFELEGGRAIIGASAGIAFFPAGESGPNAEIKLRCADSALYRAKSEGRGIYRIA